MTTTRKKWRLPICSRSKTGLLMVGFLAFFFLGVGGVNAGYTEVFSDDFNRADSNDVGNGWIAPNYQLLNQSAISNFFSWNSSTGSDNPDNFLLRPISEVENTHNNKIKFTTAGNPGGAFKAYYVLSRYQNNQAYVAVIMHQFNTMSIRIKTATNGLDVLTTLISTGITIPLDGILNGEFSIESVSDTTTFLTFTLYDSSGALVDTLSIEDSTPDLQTTGQVGFVIYDSKGALGWDNIIIASSTDNNTNDDDQALYSPIIGFIGDSITAANSPVIREIANLGNGLKAINRGVGATSTRSRLLGYDGTYNGSPLLPPTLTAFQNSGVQVVQIMLGTNDSSISRNVLPDEYKNNLQSMIDGLKSIGVKKVILNRSPYVLPTAANHDDQALVKMAGYMEVIKELVDGETVLLGDIEAYNYFEANQNQLSDGIHPTPAGYQQLGIFWANAYTRLLIDPYESGFAQFITNGNQHTGNTDTTLIYEVQKEPFWFTMTGFAGIEVDGQELPDSNYTVNGSNSTIITLLADYLNTLSTGNYELTIKFSDGIITTGAFTILSASGRDNNNTGGNNNGGSSSGGGGGGTSLKADSCPAGDFSPSYYDGTCGTTADLAPLVAAKVNVLRPLIRLIYIKATEKEKTLVHDIITSCSVNNKKEIIKIACQELVVNWDF